MASGVLTVSNLVQSAAAFRCPNVDALTVTLTTGATRAGRAVVVPLYDAVKYDFAPPPFHVPDAHAPFRAVHVHVDGVTVPYAPSVPFRRAPLF